MLFKKSAEILKIVLQYKSLVSKQKVLVLTNMFLGLKGKSGKLQNKH